MNTFSSKGMKVDKSFTNDGKMTEDEHPAGKFEEQISREKLVIETSATDESDRVQQNVGEACVLDAHFRSGVEVGSRLLPPLATSKMYVHNRVEGHMPSPFSKGLRAAHVLSLLRENSKTKLLEKNKSKPNSRRSKDSRVKPVGRLRTLLQAVEKPKRVELASCRRTRCRPCSKTMAKHPDPRLKVIEEGVHPHPGPPKKMQWSEKHGFTPTAIPRGISA